MTEALKRRRRTLSLGGIRSGSSSAGSSPKTPGSPLASSLFTMGLPTIQASPVSTRPDDASSKASAVDRPVAITPRHATATATKEFKQRGNSRRSHSGGDSSLSSSSSASLNCANCHRHDSSSSSKEDTVALMTMLMKMSAQMNQMQARLDGMASSSTTSL
jgi:hypothetical protein